MSASTEIAAALTEAESVISNTFTWSGTSRACSSSGIRLEKVLNEAGGFEMVRGVTLTVRLSLFEGALPASQQTFTHRSETFRIEWVEKDPTNTFLRIGGVSNTRGK